MGNAKILLISYACWKPQISKARGAVGPCEGDNIGKLSSICLLTM